MEDNNLKPHTTLPVELCVYLTKITNLLDRIDCRLYTMEQYVEELKAKQ